MHKMMIVLYPSLIAHYVEMGSDTFIACFWELYGLVFSSGLWLLWGLVNILLQTGHFSQVVCGFEGVTDHSSLEDYFFKWAVVVRLWDIGCGKYCCCIDWITWTALETEPLSERLRILLMFEYHWVATLENQSVKEIVFLIWLTKNCRGIIEGEYL